MRSSYRRLAGGGRDALGWPLALAHIRAPERGRAELDQHGERTLAPWDGTRGSESGCDAHRLSTGRSIRAWRTLCRPQTRSRNFGGRRAPQGIVGNAEMRSASIAGIIRRSGRDPLHDPAALLAELRGLVVGDSVEMIWVGRLQRRFGHHFRPSLSAVRPPRERLWRPAPPLWPYRRRRRDGGCGRD